MRKAARNATRQVTVNNTNLACCWLQAVLPRASVSTCVACCACRASSCSAWPELLNIVDVLTAKLQEVIWLSWQHRRPSDVEVQ